MAINGCDVRDVYESFTGRGDGGHRMFLDWFYNGLGLCDENGRRHRDVQKGRNVLESAKRKFRPEEVSLLDLGMGITGLSGNALESALRNQSRVPGQVDVMEAGGAVDPTSLQNTNIYNYAIAGLLEAKALEVWDRPEWIGDQLMRTVPTRKRTERFIGLTPVGDDEIERKPGMPHARSSFSDNYRTTPPTTNKGIAIEVYVETVMFDETGQALQNAEKITERVRLRKELQAIDLVLGVTNNYNYGGTSYNTYLTTGAWVNVKASNPFVDWMDVDEAWQLFASMTDPDLNEPIMISAANVLVMPQKILSVSAMLNSTQLWRSTQTGAETAITANPLSGKCSMLPTSPWLYTRARAADGLNLSEANAAGLWFLGDFQRAFWYMENFPFKVQRAAPSDYEMVDRGIAAAIFVDEMGVAVVNEPRAVVKNKNEA